MLYTLYRISDGGNKKDKLPHADKIYCLKNFISTFGKDNLIVFADNCSDETKENIKSLGIEFISISLGNSLSFLYILDFALKNFQETDAVYFVEDDYLHLPGSKTILLEGLEIADYVTLYDHPDKYIDFDKGGPNYYIANGGEKSIVMATKSSHWKNTNSTTMTFAASVAVLKKDYAIWCFFKVDDFLAFQKLIKQPLTFTADLTVLQNKMRGLTLYGIGNIKQAIKIIFRHLKNKWHRPKRTLVVCIPGKSTHIEINYLSPLTQWDLI